MYKIIPFSTKFISCMQLWIFMQLYVGNHWMTKSFNEVFFFFFCHIASLCFRSMMSQNFSTKDFFISVIIEKCWEFWKGRGYSSRSKLLQMDAVHFTFKSHILDLSYCFYFDLKFAVWWTCISCICNTNVHKLCKNFSLIFEQILLYWNTYIVTIQEQIRDIRQKID